MDQLARLVLKKSPVKVIPLIPQQRKRVQSFVQSSSRSESGCLQHAKAFKKLFKRLVLYYSHAQRKLSHNTPQVKYSPEIKLENEQIARLASHKEALTPEEEILYSENLNHELNMEQLNEFLIKRHQLIRSLSTKIVPISSGLKKKIGLMNVIQNEPEEPHVNRPQRRSSRPKRKTIFINEPAQHEMQGDSDRSSQSGSQRAERKRKQHVKIKISQPRARENQRGARGQEGRAESPEEARAQEARAQEARGQEARLQEGRAESQEQEGARMQKLEVPATTAPGQGPSRDNLSDGVLQKIFSDGSDDPSEEAKKEEDRSKEPVSKLQDGEQDKL